MAIELIDKIKPKNNGTFAMVDAEDVAMPDGTRLSEYKPSSNTIELLPETRLAFTSPMPGASISVFDFTLTDGESYRIAFNGEEFNCVASGGMLGNLSLTDESQPNTGEPFLIESMAEGIIITAPTLTDTPEYEIYQNDTLIHESAVLIGMAPGVWMEMQFAVPVKLSTAYCVVWDGTEYEVVPNWVAEQNAGMLGNMSIVGGEDTGEPFLVVANQIGEELLALGVYNNVDTEQNVFCYHTLAISEKVSPVPAVGTADEGKVLQVVNGKWTAVSVADSSVKTFVDEYISSALEGDY